MVESGVLKGLHFEDIKRAGQTQLLQDGCRGFFEKLVKREEMKKDVHVLSSSWCGDLIRSAFSSGTHFKHPHLYFAMVINLQSLKTFLKFAVS